MKQMLTQKFERDDQSSAPPTLVVKRGTLKTLCYQLQLQRKLEQDKLKSMETPKAPPPSPQKKKPSLSESYRRFCQSKL